MPSPRPRISHMRRFARVVLRVRAVPALLALGAALSGCATPGGPPLAQVAPEINGSLERRGTPLAAGDLLQVTFTHRSDWDRQVTVSDDGQITLPEIGAVDVGGQPPTAIEVELEERYHGVLDMADITLDVITRRAETVTVLGEVGTPGEIELGDDGRLTLLDAIGQAGSFDTRSAYLANLLLVRWDASEGARRVWRIDARPRHWDGTEPLWLQAYDVVYIPNTPIDRVGIWVDNYIRRLIPLPFFSMTTP